MKKPFQVGERVRVYDGSRLRFPEAPYVSLAEFTAAVAAARAEGEKYFTIVSKVITRTHCYGDKVSGELHKLLDDDFRKLSELERLELLYATNSLVGFAVDELMALRAQASPSKQDDSGKEARNGS